jgi:hypothetical protein
MLSTTLQTGRRREDAMSQRATTSGEQPELHVVDQDPPRPARRRKPAGQQSTSNGHHAPQQPMVIREDVWIYRIVVSSLGLVLLITAAGGVLLPREAPSNELLIALASGSVGALAGLLSPTRTR